MPNETIAVGSNVTVYLDPITQKKREGSGIVKKIMSVDTEYNGGDEMVKVYCTVRFDNDLGGETYQRIVYLNTRFARKLPNPKTITLSELKRLSMANKVDFVVNLNGRRQRDVGIGFVDEGDPLGDEVLVVDDEPNQQPKGKKSRVKAH